MLTKTIIIKKLYDNNILIDLTKYSDKILLSNKNKYSELRKLIIGIKKIE